MHTYKQEVSGRCREIPWNDLKVTNNGTLDHPLLSLTRSILFCFFSSTRVSFLKIDLHTVHSRLSPSPRALYRFFCPLQFRPQQLNDALAQSVPVSTHTRSAHKAERLDFLPFRPSSRWHGSSRRRPGQWRCLSNGGC